MTTHLRTPSIAAGLLVPWLFAAPAGAQVAALAASDFTLTLSRIDVASGSFVALDTSALATYFSAARCACPTNVVVGLTLNSDSVAKLASGDGLDATVMIGSDCDNAAASGCRTLGSALTLDASKTASSQTLSTGDLFGAVDPGVSCGALSSTSTRLWTIIRQNGARLDSQPSLSVGFGGEGPAAPTGVAIQTADSGLLVSWAAVADTTTIQGYQVLCSPGPTGPPAAAYETCANASPGAAAGPFAPLDPALVCSGLISAGTTSARVHGLENGRTYQIAVVAVGTDGTASAPSAAAEGVPGPTFGFDDIYFGNGGMAAPGCAVAGSRVSLERASAGPVVLAAIAMALIVARRRPTRRRRRRHPPRARAPSALLAALTLCLGWAGLARADDDVPGIVADAARPSPRRWNLELRFGPYLPDVDSEFADRGQTVRPFREIFSSSKRLMTQLELDRQLLHLGGTWAVGLAAGYYRASASSLAADQVTRTGDETALRLVPLSVSLVYRADLLHDRTGFPLIPYAKAGLDCTLWSISDTAKTGSTDGRTAGWHVAGGVSLDLAFLDPESARTMDLESGVNQLALFVEVARYTLDGFGAGSVLRVGDTTWLTGLMLEM